MSFFHFWNSIHIFLNFFLLSEPLAQIFFLIFSWVSIHNFLNFFFFDFIFFTTFSLPEISQVTVCFLKFPDSEVFCPLWRLELFRFCEDFLVFLTTLTPHVTRAWQASLKKSNCYEKLFEDMKRSFEAKKKDAFRGYIMYFRFFHGISLSKNTRLITHSIIKNNSTSPGLCHYSFYFSFHLIIFYDHHEF